MSSNSELVEEVKRLGRDIEIAKVHGTQYARSSPPTVCWLRRSPLDGDNLDVISVC